MLDIDSVNHIVSNSQFVIGASDPGSWIDNGTEKLKEWGAKGATFLGSALVILALWFLFKTIASKSGRGKNAMLCLGALVVGGVLVYGGVNFLESISNTGYNGVKGIKD
ncbi:hypothetical protein [Staphylococcus equorum]|uniref:hypothetical protein n=1 Tax=Staphylococcus equorum TaxID=246432 RepID=UPI001867C49A|nr:hypothetical protein [Staphylococcus equorum]